MNLLLLTFHMKQPNKTTTVLLYCLMNGTDLLICFLMIPAVISCWYGSEPLLFNTRVAREIWLFIWEVSGRMSVFLIGLQSVLRTRALLFPFSRRLNKIGLVGIIIIYTTILCSIQSVRFFYHVYSVFSPRTTRPTLFFQWVQTAMGPRNVGTNIFMFLNNLFGYVIPFLPITVSCGISIHCIRKSRRATQRRQLNNPPPGNTDKPAPHTLQHRAATTTVLILTLVYIVTNAPLFVVELNEMLIAFSVSLNKDTHFINWTVFIEQGHYLEYVFIYVTVYNVCVLLNSTLNGCVFLIRTALIRDYIADTFQQLVRGLQCKRGNRNVVITNRSVSLAVTELSKTETVM